MTVEQLLNKKKIPFRISGRDFVVSCLNPEHDDKNPSMRIDKIIGMFNCLSCGYAGNIFYLFEENFDKLAIYRENVKRKMEDIRASSIGLKFPVSCDFVEKDYRVSAQTLKEFEAFRSLNTEYINRVIFPIRDLKGKITCFIGRAEDPFELSKYKIIPSNSKVPLFPLQKVEPVNGRILLVEGLFDLLNLYDNNFRNVICAFGTNQITKEKLQLLKVLGISGIDICFDPDKPGQDAAEKVKKLAEELYFNVRNINLKTCDPGDLTSERAAKLKDKLYD